MWTDIGRLVCCLMAHRAIVLLLKASVRRAVGDVG